MRKKSLIIVLILALSIILVPMSMPVSAQGSGWSPMTSGTSAYLRGVWGSSSSDVFTVGDGGTILHYDGAHWSPMVSGTTYNLNGVWGSSSSNVYAVGQSSWSVGTILHYDGVSWSTVPITSYNLQGIWGSSPSDIYAVGGTSVGGAPNILHYDGISWNAVVTNTHGGDDYYAVWGTSSSDVFVVGHYAQYTRASVLHYDGVDWSRWYDQYIAANYLKGVWGSSPSDVFAVGHGPTVIHYDGADWSVMDSGITNEHFYDVWGTSSSDVFAVGTRGKIIHYDGANWNLMTSGTTRQLWGVWGTSHSNVFAVGEAGTILHYSCPQVETATHTGLASVCTGSGTLVNLTAVAESSIPSEGKPNLQFPHGFFEFQITGLTSGETVTLTIELPSAVPDNTQYWKYGPTIGIINPHWYEISMGDNDGDNVITITLQDGGDGDDDLTANGVIVDQGGPGNPGGGPDGATTGVPVLPSLYIGIAAAFGAAIIAFFVRKRLLQQY